MTMPSSPHKFQARAEGDNSLYGYVPTEWICILFVVLFGMSGLLHLGQAIRYRLWWLLPTAILAAVAEVIGWSGRLWSSLNPTLLDPYLMQITTTIIAPTPLVASNFIILGRIIGRLGPQYSRLSPGWYTIVFCTCDIIALVVQAVGGASASSAVQNGRDPAKGGNIMLGGIAFQLAAICIYVACAVEFFFRYLVDMPVRKISQDTKNRESIDSVAVKGSRYDTIDGKLKFMIAGLAFSTLCIFIRSVYRTIELSDGWSGRIITTQVYFNVLDGAMIVLAIYTLNAFHPGLLLLPTDRLRDNQQHFALKA